MATYHYYASQPFVEEYVKKYLKWLNSNLSYGIFV